MIISYESHKDTKHQYQDLQINYCKNIFSNDEYQLTEIEYGSICPAKD